MDDNNNRKNVDIDNENDVRNADDTDILDGEMMELPMIPLRGLSVFPNMVLHFDIGREKSINALEKAMVMNQYIFLASQKDDNTDLPTPDDFYHIGTVGKIKQMLKLPGDSIRVLVEGVSKRSKEQLFGRTEQNKVVVFDRGTHRIGDFVTVRITDAGPATLKGETVE